MKKVLALIVASAVIMHCESQRTATHQLSDAECKLFAISLGMNFTGAAFQHYKRPLTDDEIMNADAQQVNWFDRSATTQFSLPARDASDVLLLSSLAVPFVLMADKPARRDGLSFGALYLQTMSWTAGEVNLLKGFIHRKRPFVYNSDAPLEWKKESDARASFCSGHTALSSASCFFGAFMFSDYYRESKLKPAVWVAAAAIPLTTGYLRYRAGKHFFTDIAVGYLIGFLNAWIVHKRNPGELEVE